MLPFTGGYHYEKGFPFEAYQEIVQKNLMIKKKAYANKNITIVALNSWMKNKSNKSVLLNQFHHEIIPNGLDTNVFKPLDQSFARSALGLPNDKKILLFVSDSIKNKRKGINFLIDIIPRLSITNSIILAIGGKVNELDDFPNIYKIPKISNDRLLALAYSASNLFLLPSIEDNLPNTVLESLSCGTPVVAFNIGGIPDILINNQNGFVCEKLNAESLKETIFKALKFEFDRKWIREDAVSRFNEKVQAQRYHDLFSQILNKNTNKKQILEN